MPDSHPKSERNESSRRVWRVVSVSIAGYELSGPEYGSEQEARGWFAHLKTQIPNPSQTSVRLESRPKAPAWECVEEWPDA